MRNAGSLVLVCLCALAACDVGQAGGPGDPDPDQPDSAPVPGGPDAQPGGGPDAGTTVQCRTAVANVGSGNHNAGEACLASGCHGPNPGGPRFTLGGTLYTAIGGGAVNTGATITVRDAAGLLIDLPTMRNGNFYTSQNVTYPVTVFASKCPGALSMSAPAATGDCNSAGCHAAAGGTGRIYLP